MSKADKMRGRLASIQKDREQFEQQKKALEADMHIGRNNMSKIKKGLKNNSIIDEPIVIDPTIAHVHEHRHSHPHPEHRNSNSHTHKGPSNKDATSAGNGTVPSDTLGTNLSAQQSQIMPSGPRISDWCYTSPVDSTPPAVKSKDLYETVRLLGRGSFGEVSLVKNCEDNKLFAIKSQLCPKEGDYLQVLREVRFLRANRHPCIIDVHDAFMMANPRIVYIVMHYCETGTLSSVISSARKNKSTLAENQVVKWTLQLALALQFLHENGCIHRDLKPMNVMLTEGGDTLKLADFGLAMSMTQKADTEATDEAGTPYYTAPEMIQGNPYSYPADCWSFGIIVHQLLALERPFEGGSTAELVRSILLGVVQPLPAHYSDDIKLISRELLRQDQTERLSMTELLLEPLFFQKLGQFPTSYRPRTLEERIRRAHQKQLEVQIELLGRIRRGEAAATAVPVGVGVVGAGIGAGAGAGMGVEGAGGPLAYRPLVERVQIRDQREREEREAREAMELQVAQALAEAGVAMVELGARTAGDGTPKTIRSNSMKINSPSSTVHKVLTRENSSLKARMVGMDVPSPTVPSLITSTSVPSGASAEALTVTEAAGEEEAGGGVETGAEVEAGAKAEAGAKVEAEAARADAGAEEAETGIVVADVDAGAAAAETGAAGADATTADGGAADEAGAGAGAEDDAISGGHVGRKRQQIAEAIQTDRAFGGQPAEEAERERGGAEVDTAEAEVEGEKVIEVEGEKVAEAEVEGEKEAEVEGGQTEREDVAAGEVSAEKETVGAETETAGEAGKDAVAEVNIKAEEAEAEVEAEVAAEVAADVVIEA